VRVAWVLIQRREGDAAGPARLVLDQDRLVDQVATLGDVLDHPHGLIECAPWAGGHGVYNRLDRLPFLRTRRRRDGRKAEGGEGGQRGSAQRGDRHDDESPVAWVVGLRLIGTAPGSNRCMIAV
jgi:hypothetical protein